MSAVLPAFFTPLRGSCRWAATVPPCHSWKNTSPASLGDIAWSSTPSRLSWEPKISNFTWELATGRRERITSPTSRCTFFCIIFHRVIQFHDQVTRWVTSSGTRLRLRRDRRLLTFAAPYVWPWPTPAAATEPKGTNGSQFLRTAPPVAPGQARLPVRHRRGLPRRRRRDLGTEPTHG